MRKHKRLLSFLLAAFLLLSVPTAAFTAFAADDGNAVADMEAYLKDATVWTDEMGTKWKALTEEQKDAVNHYYAAKAHYLAWQKVGGGMNKDRETKAGELLGGYTSKTRAAMDFTQKMATGTYTVSVSGVETTIDLGKSGWKSGKWDYVNNYTYKNGTTEITITPAQQKAVYDKLLAEYNQMTVEHQSLSDYINGGNAAYVYFGTGCRLNNTHVFMLNFLPQAKAAVGASYTPAQLENYFLTNFGFSQVPEWDLLGGVRYLLEFRDKQYLPYLANAKPTDAQDDAYLAAYTEYKKVIDNFSSMPSIAKNTYAAFVALNDTSTGLGTLNSNFAKLYNDIIGKQQGDAFNEKVSKINIPAQGSEEFNATIIELQKEYTALTALGKARVAPYYYELVGKYINNTGLGQNESTHVVPEQVKVEAQAPELINNVLQNSLAPAINMVAGNLLGSINSMFTGDLMNAAFLSSISTELGKQMAALAFTPDKLASMIGEDELQFAKAKKEMTGKTDWADVGYLDWGVINGDYETFSKALCAALRGVLQNGTLNSLAGLRKAFEDTFTLTKDGTIDPKKGYTFGLYGSVLVPVLEMCGVDNFISSYEYTQRANGHRVRTGTNDMYLKLMLDEVYYKLLPKVAENPADFLVNYLPNLVYHLEDGCIFRDVEASLRNTIGLLADPLVALLSPYLGFEKIWNLLTLPGTDANGNPTVPMLDLAAMGINLTYEDLTFIAKLGKGEVTETECKKYDSTVTITADKQSVKNYLVNLVYGVTEDFGIQFNPQGTFVKQEAPQYPHNGKMDKKVINAVIDGGDTLLGSLVNLKDVINNGVFTNEMAANAITGIYSLLGTTVTPKMVAAMMTEDRYADLRVDLDFDSWADVALVVKNDNAVVYQTNMGFKNGDRQGFLDCVTASLRPVLAGAADLLINTEDANGTVHYGLYETLIIPVMEALGLDVAANSETYTNNYEKLVKKADKNKAYDYLANTILNPVLALLDSFAAAPFDTLTKLLPNLAYAVQYNPDVAIVGNLLAGEDGSVNLAGLIEPLIQGIIPGFTLPELDLDALASCGNLVEKDSQSVLRGTYTVVEADQADAFVTIYYYLYDAINHQDNLKLVKEMLSGIENMDAALQGVVDSILNDIFTGGKEESLCKLGGLLASDAWECPDMADPSGTKTPSTGDGSISVLVIMGFMAAAGAAIVVLRRKKQAQI